MISEMGKVALSYSKLHGFVTIPCSKGKEGKGADVRFKKYEKTKPTVSEIEEWFRDDLDPTPNIGLVCGQNSGVVDLDIDDFEAFEALGYDIPDNTPMVKTPDGGGHYTTDIQKGNL